MHQTVIFNSPINPTLFHSRHTKHIFQDHINFFLFEILRCTLLQELHYAWCKLVSIYRETRGKLLKAKLQAFPRSYCETALTNSNPAS